MCKTIFQISRLPSPPKPRRMLMVPGPFPRQPVPAGFVMPQIPNSPAPMAWTGVRSDIENFESQVVEGAVRNLPNVLSEVINIQKGQANDIQALQEIVQNNKDKLTEVEGNRDELLQEISSLTKRIYMIEENIKENGKSCRSLKCDIDNLVIELYEKERDVRLQEEDSELEMRKLRQHREKKVKFEKEVDQYESKTSEIQKKMNEIKERLEALREQKSIMEKDKTEAERITKGTVSREIQSDIEKLREKINDAEEDSKTKKDQIIKEHEKQNQISQSIQVLQKRNAAQMTRLHRQLKDVRLQNKKWTNQISNLEMKINQLRNEVETV